MAAGVRSITTTWNSAGYQKQTEVKAYGAQAAFYEEFINECIRLFPEIAF